MRFDMNAMLKQADQMQEQMLKAQKEAKQEVVQASAGGGVVMVKASGAGELVEIRIDPRAVDPATQRCWPTWCSRPRRDVALSAEEDGSDAPRDEADLGSWLARLVVARGLDPLADAAE